jgi:hypothetical protein
MLLKKKLLNQGPLLVNLESSLRKFYGRHHGFVSRYGKSMYIWRHIYVLLVYVQMTTDICVTCRNHNHILSSFVYVQMTTDICVTCLCTNDHRYMCYLSMYKWRQIYVFLVVITTMSSPHSSMYKWQQIYVLLVYVQMTTDICVTCRNHNHVLSSFVTMYKWPQIYLLLVVITTMSSPHSSLCTNDDRYMCYLS